MEKKKFQNEHKYPMSPMAFKSKDIFMPGDHINPETGELFSTYEEYVKTMYPDYKSENNAPTYKQNDQFDPATGDGERK